MIKVTITTDEASYIEEQEIIRKHERRAKAAIRKERIAELMAAGVEKEIAKVMAEVEESCQVRL